jgi:hypothetical protein
VEEIYQKFWDLKAKVEAAQTVEDVQWEKYLQHEL